MLFEVDKWDFLTVLVLWPTGLTVCKPVMKCPEQEGEECCAVVGGGEGTPGGIREAGQGSFEGEDVL